MLCRIMTMWPMTLFYLLYLVSWLLKCPSFLPFGIEYSTEAKVLPHFPSYFVPYCHVSWILTSMWCCQGRRIKETIVDPDHEPQSSDSRCLSSVSRTQIIIERKHREHNSQFNIFYTYTYIVSQALILMFWFWFIINIHKHFSGN